MVQLEKSVNLFFKYMCEPWCSFYQSITKNKPRILCILGWKSRDSVPKLVEDYLSGKMIVDEFVTHTMEMDKINDAFDLMHAGTR